MHSLNQSESAYLKFWEKMISDLPELFVLIPHEKPDFDALASSQILHRLLMSKVGIKSVIMLDTPALETKYVLEELNIRLTGVCPGDLYEEEPYDTVLVDVSNPERFVSEQLKQLIKKSRRIFAIDHHLTDRSALADIELLYYQAPATTEIALKICDELGFLDEVLEDEHLVKLAILGLITDTSFFTIATPDTFRYMSLLSERTQYTKIVETLKKGQKRSLPERLARLKAMQRVMLDVVNGKIACITHVGSYESKAANTLLELGADVAIVISPKREKGKKFLRVILRSRDVRLEPIIREIAETYGGTYGILMDRAGGIQISTGEKVDKIKKTLMQITLKHIASRKD